VCWPGVSHKGNAPKESNCHFDPFGDAQDKLWEKSFFVPFRNHRDLSDSDMQKEYLIDRSTPVLSRPSLCMTSQITFVGQKKCAPETAPSQQIASRHVTNSIVLPLMARCTGALAQLGERGGARVGSHLSVRVCALVHMRWDDGRRPDEFVHRVRPRKRGHRVRAEIEHREIRLAVQLSVSVKLSVSLIL
jgi:hypothetical protein